MEKTNEEIYTTQLANIRKHLNEGKSITALEALNLYGCFRLSAHIHTLRHEEGMNIATEWVVKNRKRFAKYSLVR